MKKRKTERTLRKEMALEIAAKIRGRILANPPGREDFRYRVIDEPVPWDTKISKTVTVTVTHKKHGGYHLSISVVFELSGTAWIPVRASRYFVFGKRSNEIRFIFKSSGGDPLQYEPVQVPRTRKKSVSLEEGERETRKGVA